MAKMSIKELTSRSMSVMISVDCLDRLTTVLTTIYNDFIEGSQSQFLGPKFKDWLRKFPDEGTRG